MNMTKKNVFLTNNERNEFFRLRAAGTSRRVIQDKFKITKSTYYRILSRPIPSFASSDPAGRIKKVQKSKYFEIDQKVLDAFSSYRELGLPVSGPLLQTIAKRKAAGIIDDPTTPEVIRNKYLKATFGESWLDKFKLRHQLRSLRLNGERAAVPDDWEEKMECVSRMIADLGVSKDRIYNWDETGFFFRSMPKYTLAGRGDDGAGGKEDKQRITALLCVNGDGSDRELVLIGKSAKPRGTDRAFWIDNGVRYFANESAWMTGPIFTTLLKEFDQRMEGRAPVVLLLDNFCGHSSESFEELQNVIPVFLPANSTSKTQPLDAGIISAFKTKFRRKLMEFVCERVDACSFRINQITVRLIVPWMKQALMQLSASTIERCFASCLRLEIFDNQPEPNGIEEDRIELGNAVKRFLSVDDINESLIAEFVMGVEDENEMSEPNLTVVKDDVVVENPTKLLKLVDRLEQYFVNTSCPKEVKMAKKMKSRLIRHLNFK